jgi:hypothetical protein
MPTTLIKITGGNASVEAIQSVMARISGSGKLSLMVTMLS